MITEGKPHSLLIFDNKGLTIAQMDNIDDIDMSIEQEQEQRWSRNVTTSYVLPREGSVVLTVRGSNVTFYNNDDDDEEYVIMYDEERQSLL